jgi:hypothetical protein
MINSNRELNFQNIKDFVASCDPVFILLALVCMVFSIAFEGFSLHLINAKLGYKRRLISSMVYASADVYYSAITPSATGGQPASAYYMIKDDIDAGVTTLSLLTNLVAYTAAILVVSLCAFVLRGKMFFEFKTVVKLLVGLGVVLQILLLTFFVLCMRHSAAVLKVGNGLISLLSKIKIIKKTEKWRNKLQTEVEKYRSGYEAMKKQKLLFWEVLLLNVAQRLSQIFIICFVCHAADSTASFVDLFAMQAFVILGYNSIPLPGGVGAFEYLYLNIFGLKFGNVFVTSALMVSRSISYYLRVIVSGVMTLAYHVSILKRKKGTSENPSVDFSKNPSDIQDE